MRTFEDFTELEKHVIQYFNDIKEPLDMEWCEIAPHVLFEHLDGYSEQHDGKYVYASDDVKQYDDDVELLTKFIDIVSKDMNGEYFYEPFEYKNVIVKALKKFGL